MLAANTVHGQKNKKWRRDGITKTQKALEKQIIQTQTLQRKESRNQTKVCPCQIQPSPHLLLLLLILFEIKGIEGWHEPTLYRARTFTTERCGLDVGIQVLKRERGRSLHLRACLCRSR